jgi:hypothetical protein
MAAQSAPIKHFASVPDLHRRPSAVILMAAFILPLSQLVSSSVGGTIYGQDVLALVLFPILLMQKDGVRRLAQVKTFFLFLGFWLLGQIITDLIRGTSSDDYIRGWSKIGFFGLQFAVLWLFLSRNFFLFVAYMFGLGCALILHTFQLEPPYSDAPWKFGLGIGIVTLAAVFGSQVSVKTKSGNIIPAVLLTIAGAVTLLNGSRAVFGVALLSAGYVYVADKLSTRPRLAASIRPAQFTGFIVAGFLFCQILISAYGFLAESGTLGYEAKDKYEIQSSGDTNILLGGRAESLVSTVAIKDSPIIGHGSWAHDIYYARLLRHKMTEASGHSGERIKSDLIPSHSHLLGAWVEAGVAGALFWGWVLVLCIVGLYQLLKLQSAPSPIIAVSIFSMLWDIPFSPFGAEVRFTRAGQIALLLYVLQVTRERRAQKRLDASHEDRSTQYPFQRSDRMTQVFPNS